MTDFEILRRFAIVTLITIAGLAIFRFLLEDVFGFGGGSSSAVITILVPALEVGQTYAKRTQQYLAPGRMWRLAFWFVIINGALGVAVIAILWILAALPFSVDFLISPLFLTIALVFAGIYLLIARFFLWLGQKLHFRSSKNKEHTAR